MAQLAVIDHHRMFIISGTGDIIEPDDHVVAIGSGAGYAKAAAQALVKYSNLTAAEIVTEALKITAAICIYTNEQITVLEL
jgi:ATP-dependent HslUV protease subunit HslV